MNKTAVSVHLALGKGELFKDRLQVPQFQKRSLLPQLHGSRHDVQSSSYVSLLTEENGNAQYVLAEAGSIMTKVYGVYECTVQIEYYVDEMFECTDCQEPLD